MNKRGQFYLIAAIVIVSIMLGFVAVTNYTSATPTSNINYLKEEISIESSKTIDYGTYNQFNNVQMQNLMINFSNDYINSSYGYDLYFIFGNSQGMTFMAYQNNASQVWINGQTANVGAGQTYTQKFSPLNKNIVQINSYNYTFLLNSGENFHFILSNINSGQDYLAYQ